MYDFHKDRTRYFEMQYQVTRDYIVPFLNEHLPEKKYRRVLEIGCGEAGVLKYFLQEGAFCTGIELSPSKFAMAQRFHDDAIKESRIEIINRNIFDIDPEHDLDGRYDLVILKDVIEHIPGQREFIGHLPLFLNEGGVIFFAFPPWQMPFGGHQQVCKSRLLKYTPYFHLLPSPVYKGILKLSGESPGGLAALMEIKETGISIGQFEKYLRLNRLGIIAKRHYLFNPIYFYKFGIKPRLQFAWVSRIPWLRNFVTTGVYYVVK